jgi:type IV pilus assembly protein PilM
VGLTWINGNQRIQPIGLDFGHSCLKMIQIAANGNRLRMVAAGRMPMDPHVMNDPQKRHRALVPAIRHLLSSHGFQGRRAVSAVSANMLRITSLRLAEAETPQADRALRREAAERFGLDPKKDSSNYILAGSVRQGDELKNEYILFAVSNEAIRAQIHLLEEAGLTPAAIDAPPCALFRAFERTMRRQEDQEKTIVFIDVGHSFTTVVFARSGEICFVKQVPIGTGRFDEEVGSVLGICPAEAETLRLSIQRDEPVDGVTRRHVVDALNSVAEQMVGEISLCMRYYTVSFRGKRVERAVLSGGGAHEQIVRDVLRRHLSIEIEIADPLRGFESAGDRHAHVIEAGSADLALVVGLGLKGWGTSSSEGRQTVDAAPVLQGEPS